MASLYRRGPHWWVKFYVDGKPVYESLKTTNERIARNKVVQLEYRLSIGGLVQPSKTPLPKFLEDYCAYLETTRTHKSFKNDVSYLRIVFGPITEALKPGTTCNTSKLPTRDQAKPATRRSPAKTKRASRVETIKAHLLEDISTAAISRFITQRVQLDGISPKTANRTREVLHRLFNYAIKECGYTGPDGAAQNPVTKIDRRREAAPDIRYLDADQVDEQLAALEERPKLYAMVGTLIYSGLRREELLWLTHEDVDLERRLLRIRAKTVGGASWQPKTKRNRAVPISRALCAILEQYAMESKPNRGTWFFPTATGKRWDPDNYSQTLREINRNNGLSWSCLDYRHTFGSRLAQKGESLYKIAELMGNSPDICRKHYAALIPEQMHDVVEFNRSAQRPGDEGELPIRAATHQTFHDSPKLRLVR